MDQGNFPKGKKLNRITSAIIASSLPFFAAQTLANVKMFASDKFAQEKLGRSKATGEIDMDKFNVMGSSIAYGHPFAATGTRMITQMLNELNRRGGGTGLITACAAGGLGAAMILETA